MKNDLHRTMPAIDFSYMSHFVHHLLMKDESLQGLVLKSNEEEKPIQNNHFKVVCSGRLTYQI